MARKMQGFTLIELVIVVIILGLLAVTALPRFFSAQEQAQDATVDGVAGGFASAVSLVRAEWELEGRPDGNIAANQTQVTMDQTIVGVDGTIGFPTGNGTAANTTVGSLNNQGCLEVFSLILQSPPTVAVTSVNFKNTVYVTTNNGNNCHYTHSNTISTAPADGAAPSIVGSQGFTYNASTGVVQTFSI